MTTVLRALNEALHEAMSRDERVLIMGEDIVDPYGGAFKVTQGLSTRFPNRVMATPISELALVGIASGAALRGLLPVVEIMFGDFLSLAYDQILNHACKYRWMYNNQVRVPMVVRTPMGGRRGYGPTHSQSLEKHFVGIPGLRIVAPNSLSDPKSLLLNCIFANEDPVLFVEHKLLYPVRLGTSADLRHLELLTTEGAFPITTVRIADAPVPSTTVVTFGYSTELALEAQWKLAMEDELFIEVVIPTQICPLDLNPLFSSLRRTRRLVTLEEGGITAGWGSEVVSLAAETLLPGALAVKRVGALDSCIPSSKPLEAAVLPSAKEVIAAVRQVVNANVGVGVRI